MKQLKIIANIFWGIAFVALAVGASFHGYRIHPEQEETYQLGVTMGITMISVFAVFFLAGIVCRILTKKKDKRATRTRDDSV